MLGARKGTLFNFTGVLQTGETWELMKNNLEVALHARERGNEGASLKFYERLVEVNRREFEKGREC